MACTNLKRIYNKDYNPKYSYKGAKYEIEFWDVPCEECIGCLTDKSNEITQKMIYNYYTKYDMQAIFITLTYGANFLPLVYEEINEYDMEDIDIYEIDDKPYAMYENGKKLVLDNGIPIPTCKIKDFQKFMKRLRTNLQRAKLETKICYVACSEYGEDGQRPHYHAVILGLSKCKEIDDIIEKSYTIKGELIGLYDVQDCNGPKAISYVTKYTTKYVGWNRNELRQKPKVWTSTGLDKAVIETEGIERIIKNNWKIQYGKKEANTISLGRYYIKKWHGKPKKDWDKLEKYVTSDGTELNYSNEAERQEQITKALKYKAKIKEKIKIEALKQQGNYEAKETKKQIIDTEKIQKLAELCINEQKANALK